MTSEPARKRQSRRGVASDEAHAWARSLPLNNPNGKTVLRALALYVNGEGCCFVGIDQLADDTDLSADTVRRRLVWLEQVGAIVRLPQWLDANGRRNGEGKGKRTTDEIRLLLDADLDEIERRAFGGETVTAGSETHEFSPSNLRGLNEGTEIAPKSVSPAPALGHPSQLCDHLTSEPEPEVSPQPPSGGAVAVDEDWKDFEKDWVEPILRQSLAHQVWAALKPDERLLARQAARGYVAWRRSQKRPPNVLGAHLFLKERNAWEGFAKHDPGSSGAGKLSGHAIDSPEGKSLRMAYEIAGVIDAFFAINARSGRVYHPAVLTPRLLALADAELPRKGEWVKLNRQQAAAWEGLLRDFVTVGSRHALREGDRAPREWPPKVDGTWSPAGQSSTLMSEQDEADFQ